MAGHLTTCKYREEGRHTPSPGLQGQSGDISVRPDINNIEMVKSSIMTLMEYERTESLHMMPAYILPV